MAVTLDDIRLQEHSLDTLSFVWKRAKFPTELTVRDRCLRQVAQRAVPPPQLSLRRVRRDIQR